MGERHVRHDAMRLAARLGIAVHVALCRCQGRAVAMPGQHVERFPPVRAFAAVERHGFIWVWPGDVALADCLIELKKKGVTVVMISHRPTSIVAADKLLLLKDGGVELFGPRLDVLAKLAPRPVNRTPQVRSA